MNDEARLWLQYADENRRVAVLCFESGLFNPCLQNAQQAVEKSLKALCLAIGLPLKKTHSIAELIADLRCAGSSLNFVEDDIDLLDSVYLPSKYPLGSVLPNFNPDTSLAQRCLALANYVLSEAQNRLKTGTSKPTEQ